jgi:hypothetical protein
LLARHLAGHVGERAGCILPRGARNQVEGAGGLRRTIGPDDARITYNDATVRATYNGHALRMVTNGELRYLWTGTDTTLRYTYVISNTLVNSLFQDDVNLSTQADTRQTGRTDITVSATCDAMQATETDPGTGYRIVWKRVTPT